MVWWKFTCQSFRYLTTCAIACIITSFGGWKFPDGSFNPFLQIHENFSLAFERVKKKRNKRITHLPPKIWPNSYTFFFTLLWVDLNQKVVTALNSSADLNLPIRDKSLHLKFEITITSRCQCQLNHLYLISDIAEIKLSLSLNYKRTYIVELFSNQKHLCMGKHWY